MTIKPDILRELLRYDPDTGKLYWLPRPLHLCKDERICKSWNTRLANTEALTAKDGNGYNHGTIFNKNYLAHRVAWAIHHGFWPNDQIDHISGVVSDNRICNLRVVSNATNGKNQKRSSNNSSGVTGVSWASVSNKWAARIYKDGNRIHLGLFREKQDAIDARKVAEIKYGYHENHGRD